MNDDIVERLGRLQDHLHGLDADVCADAADEIERLRAENGRLRKALVEIREVHQPMWVSEEAKTAGKEPWVCCWCGTADGSWPCDTRLMADDALAPVQGDDR